MSPYPPINEQFCGNCRYFRQGECRCKSPAYDWGGLWPKPPATSWCGEWAPREVAA
jgi:hypothetical protein